MRCAECEEAEASLKCIDENLHFCHACSTQLHAKRARQHHRVESMMKLPTCDECEKAVAVIKCAECGGRRKPLVFCQVCSQSLHSKVARASHRLIPLIGQSGKCQTSIKEELIIDLTDLKFEQGKAVDCESQKLNLIGGQEPRKSTRLPTSKISSKAKEEERDPRRTCKLSSVQEHPVDHLPLKEKTQCPGQRSRRTGVDKTRAETARPKINGHGGRMKDSETEGDSTSDSCSGDESTGSDEEYGGTHRIKRGNVSFEAFVVEAEDQMDADAGQDQDVQVQSGIKERIKKMLELGLHPDTPDIEAQQALKNAQRLLTKHNLQQAEVLRGNLVDTGSLIGGMRVVELRAKGKAKQGRVEAWVQELGGLIADNFDTQYFTKGSGPRQKPIRVVFYGISHNADCAGYAFAATFNRITKMSADYSISNKAEDDKENSRDLKNSRLSQSLFTRVARSNYRKGVVAGLKEAVRTAQQWRKQNKSYWEQTDNSRTDARSNVEADEDTDTYEAMDSCSPDDDLHSGLGPEEAKSPGVSERCMAISALVLHSKRVGEDFLKEKGIKLRVRTVPCRYTAWNEEAFVQGKKDSTTIDVNQKGIRAAGSCRNKKARGKL